jgi:elongation of very long chain fatty acids protein 7
VISLALVYWIAIRYALPKFMEKREPFQLKTVLQLYNLLQITLCIVLLLRVRKYKWVILVGISIHHLSYRSQMDKSGYQLHFLWTCVGTDYSMSSTALNQLSAFQLTQLIKVVDLVETTFFCFRKKAGQISFLHVYHHITTMLFSWFSCKYFGGGMFAFSIVINAYVHLLMYTYYLMSSLGGKIQKRAMKFKPVVTIVQLVSGAGFIYVS